MWENVSPVYLLLENYFSTLYGIQIGPPDSPLLEIDLGLSILLESM